jgi:hypothetical protein
MIREVFGELPFLNCMQEKYQQKYSKIAASSLLIAENYLAPERHFRYTVQQIAEPFWQSEQLHR